MKSLNILYSFQISENFSRIKKRIVSLRKFLLITLILISPVYSQIVKQSVINASNITLWIGDDGSHDWKINKGGVPSYSGLYPKGTTGGIFTEGILLGGKVFDGNKKIIRISGVSYYSGNLPITRLFRVRSDYFKADLTDDAANFFIVPKNQVTKSMISEIYSQYEKDWLEWPAEKGAPFYDVNKDGKYEPDKDIPGVPGATQTIWINYNDNNSDSLYGSPPIGLDVRETYWAYSYTGILSNVMYKKVDIVYKGTQETPSDSKIDSAYICQFVDIDLGYPADDFIGCDTSLNLGYIYNSSDYDQYYSVFLPAPPAIGYSVLNGPAFQNENPSDSAIVNFKLMHGYKYFNSKPLTVYIAHRTGGYFADPNLDYTGALEFYNLMRGYMPEPHYPASQKVKDEFIGFGTYMLSGDPVTKEGWIDGVRDTPGDRRFWSMSGPFNLKLGDTVEAVYAIVGGLGDNHLSSITNLRYNTKGAIAEYNNLVSDITSGKYSPNVLLPSFNTSPEQYVLYQNFPNPFNSTTVIKYELPDDAHVTLVIYDILGRIIRTLVDEEKTTGIYEVRFNADNLPSGIYFSKISFNNPKSKLILDNLTKVSKLLLLK